MIDFRLVLETLSDAVVVADADGRVVYINAACEKLLLWTRDALVGRSIRTFMPARMHDAHEAGLRRFLDTRVPKFVGKAVRVPAVRQNGTELDIELTISLVRADGDRELFVAVLRDLRDRAELEDPRRQLLAISDSLPVLVALIDRSERYQFVNATDERWFGRDPDEVLGRTMTEVLGSAAYERIRPHVARALDGHTVTFEATVPYVTGGERSVRATYTPYVEVGKVQGFVVLVVDISERVRSEERLRHLIENSPLAMAMFDRDMRYLFASSRWLSDFGVALTVEEIRGRSHYEIFPDIPDHWKEIHRRCIAGEVARNDGEAFVRSDGTVHWVRWEIRPWIDDHGEIGGITIFSEDISTKKRADEALRESEERFRILADTAPVLIWVDGPQGVEFVNRTYRAFIGVEEPDIRNFDWARFVHPADRETYVNSYTRTAEKRAVFDAEARLLRHDGEYRWMRSVAYPRFSSSGTYLGYVGATFDMSKEKAAERQHEELIAQLRSAITARDEFLSIASHELRTPLTTLELQLEGLQRMFARTADDSSEDEVRRKIDMAARQSDRLTRLVEGLLNVSRISLGTLRLEVEELDVGALVREIAERHSEDVRRAGCTLSVSGPEVLLGRWDRLRLDQALTNLLVNATKYGPGKPIELTLEGTADRVRLLVRDHGIGIASEDLDRIFDRFERAVPATHYGGLGLGLYITRQIAEAHGGTVEVVSSPGDGATFTLSLPRYAAEQQQQPAREDSDAHRD